MKFIDFGQLVLQDQNVEEGSLSPYSGNRGKTRGPLLKTGTDATVCGPAGNLGQLQAASSSHDANTVFMY